MTGSSNDQTTLRARITAAPRRDAHVAKLWDNYTGLAARDGVLPAGWA